MGPLARFEIEFALVLELVDSALELALDALRRRRPAKSCLLVLRVVDASGRRVVVLVGPAGAAVVLVLVVELARAALKRVWNLLFRLPNLRLVDDASESALSVLVGWLVSWA